MTDNLTWFGGGTDDYVQDGSGHPIPGALVDVWDTQALATGTKLVDLRQYDSSGVLQTVAKVTCDPRGYYLYAVNNHDGPTYLDAGVIGATFRYQVDPNNVTDRILALEVAFAALGSTSGAGKLTGGGAWVHDSAQAIGTVFIRPTDGQYRAVNTAYTSGATYSTTDDANSTPMGDPPNLFTKALADGYYAPASAAYRAGGFGTNAVLYVGLELVAAGIPAPANGNLNQVVLTTDFYAKGADILVGLYQVNSANVETQVATIPILAGKVGVVWNVQRTDAATAGSGTATITDAAITAYDKGRKVTHASIPANTYIGQTVTPGVSFKLSSSPTAQVDVVTTAAIAGNITVGAAITHNKDDQYFLRPLQVGSTYPGKGLLVRLMFGTDTARVNTTPGAPTGLTVIATDSISVTLQWVNGSNSSQFILERDGIPYALLGTSTTFRDLGPLGTGMTSADAAGHTYTPVARRGNANSAAGTPVTGSPTVDIVIVPQATSGAMDGTKTTVTTGGGAGAGAAFGTGGAVLTLTSGSTGNFAAADRVYAVMPGSGASITAHRTKGKFHLTTTGSTFDIFLTVNSNMPTAGLTNGIQFIIGAFNWKCQFKAASFGSAGGGTGANGTNQLLTQNTYPIVSSTAVSADGNITWSSSFVAGTEYGYKVQQTNNGDGTQTIRLYVGTTAQYDADTMPLIATITLNTTMKTALQPGKVAYMQESGSALGVSQSTAWSALVNTEIAA